MLHHLPLYSFPLPFSLTLPSFHRRHPIPLPPSPSPYSPVPPNTQLPFQTSSGGEGRGGGGEGRKERYWTFPIKRDQFPRRRHPDPTSPLSSLSSAPFPLSHHLSEKGRKRKEGKRGERRAKLPSLPFGLGQEGKVREKIVLPAPAGYPPQEVSEFVALLFFILGKGMGINDKKRVYTVL